jgi:hypothetical protein
MVFGPDFRALRRLPSVAEFLIWVDDGLLPTGRCRQPIDAPRSPSPAVARTEESPRMSPRSIPVTRTARVLYRRVRDLYQVPVPAGCLLVASTLAHAGAVRASVVS